ncbi:hypothetical protein KGF57_005003, partial [Candida theae]
MTRQDSITDSVSSNNSLNYSSDNKDQGHVKDYNKESVTRVGSESSTESDQLAKNPFLNPKVEEYYRDLYTNSGYESYSAFDPYFEWTEEEEKKVIWKLNWRVAFTACLLFVSLQVDR